MSLRARIEERAHELGFVRVGVARVEPLDPEGPALSEWLERGHHGSMDWMATTRDVRLDPSDPRMLDGARSVIALATPYGDEVPRGFAPGRIARYARGRDYHNVIGKRLRKLASIIRDAGHRARASVDSMPVLERAWAQRAGIGFIGKNACLIVPGLGSHVFLSAVITDAELEPDAPMAQRCGGCVRCLEACPTDAFVADRTLDARRCISYLTIEHEGSIDPALRAGIGERLFGCDVCQDVCPFNASAHGGDPAFADDRFAAHELPALLDPDAALDPLLRGSPLQRAGREGLARNAAIVLGNAGDRRHLPILERAARSHPSASVREAANWACSRVTTGRPPFADGGG
ncbi:MAG: tRNA epoxyqueuosine(34) reductase QueG [Sandaracinaceae bacterium]